MSSRRYRHMNGIVLPSSNKRTIFELMSTSKYCNWLSNCSSVQPVLRVVNFARSFVGFCSFTGSGASERCVVTLFPSILSSLSCWVPFVAAGFVFFGTLFVDGFAAFGFAFTCFFNGGDGGVFDFSSGLRLVDLPTVDPDAKLLSDESSSLCLEPVHPIFLCVVKQYDKKNLFDNSWCFTKKNQLQTGNLIHPKWCFIHLDFFFGVGWSSPSLSLLADNAYVTAVRFRVDRWLNNDILAQQQQIKTTIPFKTITQIGTAHQIIKHKTKTRCDNNAYEQIRNKCSANRC